MAVVVLGKYIVEVSWSFGSLYDGLHQNRLDAAVSGGWCDSIGDVMLLDRLLAYTLHLGGLPGMQIIVGLVASGNRERGIKSLRAVPLLTVKKRALLVSCWWAEGSGAVSRRFSGLLAKGSCRVDDVLNRAGGARCNPR